MPWSPKVVSIVPFEVRRATTKSSATTIVPSGCARMLCRADKGGPESDTRPPVPNVGSSRPSTSYLATVIPPPAASSFPSACCASAMAVSKPLVIATPPVPKLVSIAPSG